MTRFLALLSCLILVLGLCVNVSAVDNTRASSVNVMATVSSGGNCEVSSAVTVHLDEPLEKLTYPVPVNASNITLNGKPVFTEKTEQARLVNLTKTLGGMSGDFSFTVSYSINAAVHALPASGDSTTQNRLRLELPMLAGFAYPIEQLQFSINLPGNISQNPSFVSGYHQADIEKDLTYSISGGNIAGRSWDALKDHETLTMYLNVTEEMFPQSHVNLPEVENVVNLILICAGVALVLWFILLRNWLPIHAYPAMAPNGFGAGQLGTALTMAGADLNLMVLSWAQLGYVFLRMDRRGRVYIQKRMDMGNERTDFERKCFRLLFSRRDTVDTHSPFYLRLLQNVRTQRSAPQLFRGWGIPGVKLFRTVTAAAGLLSGTCFGILLGNMLDFGWLFIIVLSAVGLICSWQIQFWPLGMFLHHRIRLWIAAGLSVLWLALGIAIGQFSLALLAVGIQVIGGFLAAFGGRRTEDGLNAMGQTLSLRRYLRKLSPYQAQQLCRENPESYFDLVPYAIALGCGSSFARKFGKTRLPVCPYVQVTGAHGLTARQWNQIFIQMLDGMSAGQKKKMGDIWQGVLKNYMR